MVGDRGPRSQSPAPIGALARRRGAVTLAVMKGADIDEFVRRFEAAKPAHRGELDHINPYTLLVAVVLSAQATDVAVNKATKALFAIADAPAKMVALGEAKLPRRIKTIGPVNPNARHVRPFSAIPTADHAGNAARQAARVLDQFGIDADWIHLADPRETVLPDDIDMPFPEGVCA